MAGPYLLAGLDIVGVQPSAGGKLITAESGDHQVFGDQCRPGMRLALLGIGMLDGPQFLAGLGVERDDEAVEGVEDHTAIRIVQTTVDGIAAGARNRRLVAVGLLHIVPDLLRVVRIAQV